MPAPEEFLKDLGFGEVEARLYVALLPHGSLTANELAKAAGVIRPNVYPALHRLEQRGAVMRLRSGGGAVQYVAVPADQLCARIARERQDAVQAAQAALESLRAPETLAPGPLFATGYGGLLAYVRRLCGEARQALLLGVSPVEAARLDDATAGAAARGVAVGSLCLCACPTPCGHCRGEVVRTALLPDAAGTRWLLCVRDDEDAVIGEIARDESAHYTVTSERPTVALAVSMMCYAAALASGGETPGPTSSADFRRWAGRHRGAAAPTATNAGERDRR